MKQPIIDFIGSLYMTPAQINESLANNDGKLVVSGVAQRAESFNQNQRRYPKEVLQREVSRYKSEFIGERNAMGELDHPESAVVNLANVSHNMLDLWWDGDTLMCKLEILSTPSGNIARELFKSGLKVGLSSRGEGSVKSLGEGKVEVMDDYRIICWDLVSNPSTHGGFVGPSLKESAGSANLIVSKWSKVDQLINDIITLQ